MTNTPKAHPVDLLLLIAATLLGVFIPGALGFNFSTMIVGGVIALVGSLYIIGTNLKKREETQ
jgi:uncharacterized membrane protein YgaE (UPF0421/DUF939 family)